MFTLEPGWGLLQGAGGQHLQMISRLRFLIGTGQGLSLWGPSGLQDSSHHCLFTTVAVTCVPSKPSCPLCPPHCVPCTWDWSSFSPQPGCILIITNADPGVCRGSPRASSGYKLYFWTSSLGLILSGLGMAKFILTYGGKWWVG
jgi:hypothetical protein